MAENVLIIGAGFAGLSAGYQLKKKGIDFTLVEATNHWGGRCGVNHYDPENPDFYVSVGPVFCELQETTVQGYLEEFGLADQYYNIEKKTYGYYYNGKLTYIVDDGNLLHALMGIKGLPKALIPQGAKFLKNATKERKKIVGADFEGVGLEPISKYSIKEWGEKYAGPEVVDKLLGPLVHAVIIGRTDEISIAHPLALLGGMQGLGQIKGSHHIIADALYNAIKENVRLETPVEELIIEDGVAKGVRLANGEVIYANTVLSCLDAENLLKVTPNFPTEIKEALETVKYSSTFVYAFKFDRRIVPENFCMLMVPESEDSIIGTVFDENIQNLVSEPDTCVMEVFTAGWKDSELLPLSEEEREQRVREECAKVWPEFATEGKCISVARFDRAICLEKQGQLDAIHKMADTYKSQVKNLYLAGEYRQLVSCAEGAMLYGIKIANEIEAETK